MRKSLFLLYFILINICLSSFIGKNKLNNPELIIIVESYMNQFSSIPNKCNEKPYYKIYFKETDDSLGFWISAHLGKPPLAEIPPPPGGEPTSNTMEIKGIVYIKKFPLIIYDYRNSDGHGLYDISSLNKIEMKEFKNIHDSCSHVWYPEAWFFTVTKDSIYLTDKREPFILK